MLLEMLIMMYCICIYGRLKSLFSMYSFGSEGGGHKKLYSDYAFDNVDNSG